MNIIKVLVLFFCITVSSNTYTHCADHKIFIQTMKQQVDNIFAKGNKDRKYIYSKLQEMIHDHVDLKGISRFVMGKHWTMAPKREKAIFLREYEIYLTRLCTKIIYKYMNDSEMTVMSTRVVDDNTCLVNTRFSYGNEEFTNVDFKITKDGNSFSISDVVMSGISIAINQRSQFNEKIDMHSITNVIEELKCSNSL
ncbi:MlaC/ttg2D family ABC transporter substrate-binding protein [Wolbachia endosymbiont of Ctenocephalides felis wCfeT]|uniref:MlaC/ttg2D family ABC transporter substrate-binding protein n=1 Tax=Wolbachia endosymbiont of Ctenocephalides felis wCfeT TaxID=2732593 RepID=UPI0014466B48|nr:ABC transporter substrate-binding protein [Wolbachia endosymbiont of Ctenocephalides felis wCfeT]